MKKIAFLLSCVYFMLLLVTLTHYGINWDTINHLPRGQAYLNYYLSGSHDYSNLPRLSPEFKEEFYFQNPDSLKIDTDIEGNHITSRSYYQSYAVDYDYFLEKDGGGHPPASDILSSVFNRIFFGKLGLINDIDSYRLYGITLSAILIGLVTYWIGSEYGLTAGIFSALALAMYPLYWSESHFNNEKDIPETVFWSFMFFAVWKGVTEKKYKWILLSGLFFGLALGTKFNILFAVFALVPWVLYYFTVKYFPKNKNRKLIKKHFIKTVITAVGALLIGISIFVLFWPYLWPNPLGKITSTVGFYKDIGTTQNLDLRFVGPFGFSEFPTKWILFTTPPVLLVFFFFGLIYLMLNFKKDKKATGVLLGLWLAVPVLRASWPGASTYGGIRQIMEYIPAFSIITGLGAAFIYQSTKLIPNLLRKSVVFLGFIFVFFTLVSIHPNENIYFNSLIGGLSGARDKNIPYWGFSFGSPYRRAISYVNKIAQPSSDVVFAYDLLPNIPKTWVRRDLVLQNSNRSGYLRNGEYAMALIYEGVENRSYYEKYLTKFINPVYEEKVDGVSVVRVWKNSDEHLMLDAHEQLIKDVEQTVGQNKISFDLKQQYPLSRLEIDYNDDSCAHMDWGFVKISNDTKNWETLPGTLPDFWRISYLGEQPANGHFIEPFVGETARYIEIQLYPDDTCLKNITNFDVYYFDKLNEKD